MKSAPIYEIMGEIEAHSLKIKMMASCLHYLATNRCTNTLNQIEQIGKKIWVIFKFLLQILACVIKRHYILSWFFMHGALFIWTDPYLPHLILYPVYYRQYKITFNFLVFHSMHYICNNDSFHLWLFDFPFIYQFYSRMAILAE